MNVFLLDLWHDLREKRLAPVAVVLALALLAVPFVLREKPEAAPVEPTAAAPADEGADSKLAVKALQESALPSSDLGVFDPKDPFKPLAQPKADSSAGQATLPPSDTAAAVGAGAEAGATPLSGSGGGSIPDSGSDFSPSPGSGTPLPAPQSTPKRKIYTYVVDLEFGKSGEETNRKGVKRLTLLPDKDNPLVVFLGVQTDAKRAVFLLDSSLSQAGEGKCDPDGDDCTFLELQDVKSKDEHFLTDEAGQEYRIKLVDIRRVEIKPAKKAAKKSGAKRGARPKAKASSDTNIFETLLFADESR